jgi:L-ascorbate metabolism protein UlaG (beta-lactamase superfamily)
MAGVLVHARGTVILIDPLLAAQAQDGQMVSEAGYRLAMALPIQAEAVPHADRVLYTHADDDHFGRTTARILAERMACRFLAPPPVARELEALGIAAQRIQVVKEGDAARVGAVEIEVTPAMHDWQAQYPWTRADCCGYLLRTPDGSVWHPGDTRWIEDLRAYKNVDVLFFDVAAVDAHLGPEGSARLAASCGAKVMIAYHYGLFDLPPGSFGSCDPHAALPYLQNIAGRYLQLLPGEVLELPLNG